ncbi:LamG domain-containing protein [Hymenobacter jejuensis]|uniref:LamG domain-containing protein n=1 Tax=Hymenobacter jejuensis TaxID=2502781 RepID=A0A5B7ZVS7_9BACT|nr:LamG domain-containing protein [Hymenobacter jejuensis]QDA58967.1 LamG domain-containing protein [Hymenobacter jejuensis]
MKRQKLYLLILSWLMFGAMAVVSSCSKSDNNTPTVNADKTKLTALIDSVTLGYNAAVEGTKPGTYAAGSKATLKTALDLATATKDDTKATQASVNTAVANLRRAVVTFQSSLIQEVSAANLVAQWKFNGNANDATTNANNGTLKSGTVGTDKAPVDGNTLPVLVADRFGQANQAYEFNNGAYIEVPYKVALNPQAITVSAWCKRIDTNENNYIVSLNRWNGYKFQLQSANKPFFTATTTVGIFDKDAETGVVALNTWTHVATSYVDGTTKFYVNGALVKTWTDTKGAMKAVPELVNLCIGQQLPKDVYNRAPKAGQAADYFAYYGPSYFKGQLDDIRIYNRALTDAEIQSIFTIESTK